MLCGALLWAVAGYRVILCCVVFCSVVLCCTTLYDVVLRRVVL